MNILGIANSFKRGETEENIVFFLCVLFYVKNDFRKSNQWLSSSITEAQYFVNENLKLTDPL